MDSSYFPSKTSDLLPLLSDFKITALTNDLFPNARSPRLLPGSTSKIVFLSNAANGPHFATSQLNLIDIHSLRTNVVVPIIPDTATSPEFAGLYIDNLPVDCWASSSSSTGEGETYLICSTRYKSREVIISIHIESGTV